MLFFQSSSAYINCIYEHKEFNLSLRACQAREQISGDHFSRTWASFWHDPEHSFDVPYNESEMP